MSKETIKKCKNPVGATISRPRFEEIPPKYVGAGLVPAHNKNNNGITLIALIITIIVMLILVGVSVTVALNGGLFNTAKKAVDKTEIASEKELIQRAFILAQMGNGVQEGRFRTCLEDEAGAENIELSAFEDEFEVYFKKSKRYYPVDKNGNIGEPETPVEVNNTRKDICDITKNGALDGSEEKPYEINCIEDLLALSYNTNGIKVQDDGTLGTGTAETYSGKQIILTINLNFKSKYSYENADRTDYGDVNGNGTVETLIIELTTGKGWISIASTNKLFQGTFNGNGKTINNLYIYNEQETISTGLFGNFHTGTIKNLQLSGTIYCNSSYAGGIVAKSGGQDKTQTIENCSFEGKIENIHESGNTGGIIGYLNGGTGTMINCYCRGEIIGNNTGGGNNGTGGIVGLSYSSIKIENSYNEATIKGLDCVGGIVGFDRGDELYNCYNVGAISGTSSLGGIVGKISGSSFIERCYNKGKIISSGSSCGGIAGKVYAGDGGRIYQCYNTEDVSGSSHVAGIAGSTHSSSNITIEECYNTGEIAGTTWTAGILGCLNGDNNKILNCYNTGKINGTSIAGISRSVSASRTNAKIVSCYNIGELNATTKAGVGDGGVISNSYYLQGCGATDTLATAKSAADLKAMYGTLDKAFTIDDEANTVTIIENEKQNVWVQDTNNINGGYPILKWQTEQ